MVNPVLKIGITGGIGSGKTTVCKLFEELGIRIYYSDIRAKHLMHSNQFLIDSIKKTFGEDIYGDDHKIKTAVLANKVFNTPSELQKLNSIVHPFVEIDFEEFVAKNKDEAYLIQESALIIETGNYKKLDALILVTADKETKIQRVMRRDKCTREDVMMRMSKQLDDEEKKTFCKYIIHNDDGADLNSIVKDLDQKIRNR